MKHAIPLTSGRRTVMALLLAVAIAMAVLAISPAITPRPADAAVRLVTKSFSNTQLITIPEGAPTDTIGVAVPYPSKITSFFPTGSKVRDVNVILRNYSHTVPDDVDVLLVHKGVSRTIMSDAGGYDDDAAQNVTLKLDDEAPGPLPDQPLTEGFGGGGAFQPRNYIPDIDRFPFPAPSPFSADDSLKGFDGLGAPGKWKLFVVDDSDKLNAVGRFGGGWTVVVKAAVPV